MSFGSNPSNSPNGIGSATTVIPMNRYSITNSSSISPNNTPNNKQGQSTGSIKSNTSTPTVQSNQNQQSSNNSNFPSGSNSSGQQFIFNQNPVNNNGNTKIAATNTLNQQASMTLQETQSSLVHENNKFNSPILNPTTRTTTSPVRVNPNSQQGTASGTATGNPQHTMSNFNPQTEKQSDKDKPIIGSSPYFGSTTFTGNGPIGISLLTSHSQPPPDKEGQISQNKVTFAESSSNPKEDKKEKPSLNAVYERLKYYKIKNTLKRDSGDHDKEDVQNLQTCLEFLTGQPITNNGHFGRYTEKIVKIFQEKANVALDGIVNQALWTKMIETLEKKVLTKQQGKEKRN